MFIYKEKKMSQRDAFLKEFRGEKIGSFTSISLTEEVFQNEVLRPILKLQNDLVILTFVNYLKVNKINFNSFGTEKKGIEIENIIRKDSKIRDLLKGLIIGLFTSTEYFEYSKNISNLNKRMLSMLIERVRSQVENFILSE